MNDIKNHVVSFSGGRTSAYMVWLFEQRKKTEDINVEYIFCDTGAESEFTYKFLRDVVDNWGIDLTCLRTVVNPEKGIGVTYKVVELDECKPDLVPFTAVVAKYGTPTIVNSHCTDRMKTTPSNKYCNEKYGRRNYIKWLGMRVDEKRRIKTVNNQVEMFCEEKKKKPPLYLDYLGNISGFDKQDVISWWASQSFDLQIQGEWEGNCLFCYKKTSSKVALSAKQNPEHAKKFIAMVESDDVADKPKEKNIPNNIMYRNNQSLEMIIESYKDISERELINSITKGKKLETESCSESCEATFSMDFEE